MLQKNNEAKDRKTRHNKIPEKTPKSENTKILPKFMAPTTCAPIRVKIHVFLNFAINDVMARSIFSVKLIEGTRVVILHSVLAPGDTCSTRGVRLKFEFWQLRFQGFESQLLARGGPCSG
jgi:hypothetical protein